MPGLAAGEQDVVSLVRRVARALNRRISEEDAIFVPDVLALSLQSVLAVHPATSSE